MLAGAIILQHGTRRRRSATQCGFIQINLLEDRTDRCDVLVFPAMRSGNHGYFLRLKSESRGGAGGDDRRGDKRFCRRTQINGNIDVPDRQTRNTLRINGVRRDGVHRFDKSAPRNLNERDALQERPR